MRAKELRHRITQKALRDFKELRALLSNNMLEGLKKEVGQHSYLPYPSRAYMMELEGVVDRLKKRIDGYIAEWEKRDKKQKKTRAGNATLY